MKRLSLYVLLFASIQLPAEAKGNKDACRIPVNLPPYRWNTNIAAPPSSQDLMKDKSWDKPNAIKPTEAMARIRAIKISYKSVSYQETDK